MYLINSESSPTMAAATAFNNIVQQVQSSNLNFMIQLSPFAANISLKKTPLKDHSGIPFPLKKKVESTPVSHVKDEVEVLAAKNRHLENELFKLKNEYAGAIDACESAREMVKNLQSQIKVKSDPSFECFENGILVNNLYRDIEDITKENQELKICIENKSDEIREQTKPKSSCRNQEFSETEIRFWFRSDTFSGFLVSVSVPGFKFIGLPG